MNPYDEVVYVAGGVAAANKHLLFVVFLGRRRKLLIVHDALLKHAFPVYSPQRLDTIDIFFSKLSQFHCCPFLLF